MQFGTEDSRRIIGNDLTPLHDTKCHLCDQPTGCWWWFRDAKLVVTSCDTHINNTRWNINSYDRRVIATWPPANVTLKVIVSKGYR